MKPVLESWPIVIALIACSLARADLADTSWPMFQHDPQHTGRSPYVGAQDNTLQWSRPILSGTRLPTASPVLGECDCVFIGTNDQTGGNRGLWAVNRDGSTRWQFTQPNRIHAAAAVTIDGSVLTGSSNHSFYRVNADGTLRWVVDPLVGPLRDFISSPTIGDDPTIYIGRQNSGVYAFNPDGTVAWNFMPTLDVHSSVALGHDGALYFAAVDGAIYKVSPAGSQVWRVDLGAGPLYADTSPAIADDGTIYIATVSAGLFALSPAGDIVWNSVIAHAMQNTPAIGPDGTVYVCAADHDLFAFEPDGEFKWAVSLGTGADALATSSPVIGADGIIYTSADTGTMFAVRPENGAVLWSFQTGGLIYNAAAIGRDGVIHFGSQDGNLYAVGTPRRLCDEDLDLDQRVGLGDLSLMLQDFGLTGDALTGDLDQDGDVDLVDLSELLTVFGSCCP